MNGASFLPSNPTDKQVYTDLYNNKWIYDKKYDVWIRSGASDELVLATNSQSGYMSPQDKLLLDKVPAVGGAFGIIVDTKLVLQSSSNPEGIIQGDIQLKSDSINIICVTKDLQKIQDIENCNTNPSFNCEGVDTTVPGGSFGLKFELAEKFLKTLTINLRGKKGPKGDKGAKGPKGDTGYSPGPVGEKGDPGDSTNVQCTLTGITYNDVTTPTNEAIVALDITQNCILSVTHSKINVDPDLPATQIESTPIIRTISYPGTTTTNGGTSTWKVIQSRASSSSPGTSTWRVVQSFREAGQVGQISVVKDWLLVTNSCGAGYTPVKPSIDANTLPVGTTQTVTCSGGTTTETKEWQLISSSCAEGNNPVKPTTDPNTLPTGTIQTTNCQPSATTGGDCYDVRMKDWTLQRSGTDTISLNPTLLRLPKGSNTATVQLNSGVSLNDYINGVTDEYINKLTEIDTQYMNTAKKYVDTIDNKARTILSNLAKQLAECEFNMPSVEYCITFNNCPVVGDTNNGGGGGTTPPLPPTPVPPIPPTPPPGPPVPGPPTPPGPPISNFAAAQRAGSILNIDPSKQYLEINMNGKTWEISSQ